MSLLLAIETSSARYGLALGANGEVRCETVQGAESQRDLALMLTAALAEIDARAADIEAIAVDIGPGSLGSLRDGVAFANGLAYALRRPVYGFLSFELLGAVAQRATQLPVLCTRRANEGLAYVGLYDNGRVARMRHGALERIAPQAAVGDAFALAGSFRELALPGARFVDSGVETPLARTMIEIGVAGRTASDALAAPALPLTENAAVFRE